MKKIKGNSWQFGNFGLPTSAVPVPYEYKPMGFEAFKEPLGELQASLDLAEEKLSDVDFDIQSSGLGSDSERAKQISAELYGKTDELYNIFNKTNDFSYVIKKLNELNRFYNKDKEITDLRTNQKLRSDYREKLYKLAEEKPDEYPKQEIEDAIFYADTEFERKGGTNYNSELGISNNYNDTLPTRSYEAEIMKLANTLAKEHPADWHTIIQSRPEAEFFMFDYQMMSTLVEQEKKGSRPNNEYIASILKRSTSRYQPWAYEEGKNLYNRERYYQGTTEEERSKYDQQKIAQTSTRLQEELNYYNELYSKYKDTDNETFKKSTGLNLADVANIIDQKQSILNSNNEFLDNIDNYSIEEIRKTAEGLASIENYDRRLGTDFTTAFSDLHAYEKYKQVYESKGLGGGSGGSIDVEPLDYKLETYAPGINLQSGVYDMQEGGSLTTEEAAGMNTLEDMADRLNAISLETVEKSRYDELAKILGGDSLRLSDIDLSPYALEGAGVQRATVALVEFVEDFDKNIQNSLNIVTNSELDKSTRDAAKQDVYLNEAYKQDVLDIITSNLDTETIEKIAELGNGNFEKGLTSVKSNELIDRETIARYEEELAEYQKKYEDFQLNFMFQGSEADREVMNKMEAMNPGYIDGQREKAWREEVASGRVKLPQQPIINDWLSAITPEQVTEIRNDIARLVNNKTAKNEAYPLLSNLVKITEGTVNMDQEFIFKDVSRLVNDDTKLDMYNTKGVGPILMNIDLSNPENPSYTIGYPLRSDYKNTDTEAYKAKAHAHAKQTLLNKGIASADIDSETKGYSEAYNSFIANNPNMLVLTGQSTSLDARRIEEALLKNIRSTTDKAATAYGGASQMGEGNIQAMDMLDNTFTALDNSLEAAAIYYNRDIKTNDDYGQVLNSLLALPDTEITNPIITQPLNFRYARENEDGSLSGYEMEYAYDGISGYTATPIRITLNESGQVLKEVPLEPIKLGSIINKEKIIKLDLLYGTGSLNIGTYGFFNREVTPPVFLQEHHAELVDHYAHTRLNK